MKLYTGQIATVERTDVHAQRADGSIKRTALHGAGLRTDCRTEGRGHILAPQWWMVKGHKYHGMSDQAYTQAYTDLLRSRYVADPEAFHALLREPELTLLCFCRPGTFCHRHIAADILRKIGMRLGIEVEIMPE